jgi:hypothetical protein
MRFEYHYNALIVCGWIFPPEEIEVGQLWQSSNGNTVRITKVDNDKVYYCWNGESHVKDSFSFQCRYCMILDKIT